jgi:hypothetical protein
MALRIKPRSDRAMNKPTHKQLTEPFDIIRSPDGEYLIVQRELPVLILKPDGRLIEASPRVAAAISGLAPSASNPR